MDTNPPDLSGQRILVCRPQPQADELCAHLERLGALTRALPTLERHPLPLDGAARTRLLNIDQYQHVICVSPGAADLLLEHLDQWWPQLPVGIQWWGVGQGTARTLEQAGLNCHHPSRGHNSEALLSDPALAPESITDSRILLVKGKGGRTLLNDALEERGARVAHLVLYERQQPVYDEATLQSALVDFNPNAVVTLSGDTLKHLIQLGQNVAHRLHQYPVIVPVERVAHQAREAGFLQPVVPDGLTPDALARCLAAVFDQQRT